MSGTTKNHEAQAAHAAHDAAEAERKAAEAKAKKALEPVSRDLMLLLLVTDWLHGDKHHYATIRKAVIKLLTDAGEDGAEALARLQTMPAATPTPVKAAA